MGARAGTEGQAKDPGPGNTKTQFLSDKNVYDKQEIYVSVLFRYMRHYYSSLNVKNVADNRKIWNMVKHFLLTNQVVSKKIFLIEEDRVIADNSYRKLTQVVFQPKTTEFHLDALNNWAIRPWVQHAIRSNFTQLIQFDFLFSFQFVCFFFFYPGFLSKPFTNNRTAEEGGGHFFNSSLPLPPASQTLRHQPGDCSRELTSAQW